MHMSPGVGKTHLAVTLGVKAVEAGDLALFLSLEELITKLVRAKHEKKGESYQLKVKRQAGLLGHVRLEELSKEVAVYETVERAEAEALAGPLGGSGPMFLAIRGGRPAALCGLSHWP